jgi:hypothetical protein
MKKIMPFLIIGLVLVAGIVVATKILPKKQTLTQQDQPQNQEQAQGGEKGFTGKVRDLLTLGQSLKCTWVDDSQNSSVGYIKNQAYYGEVKQEGKDSYIIIKDDCMWSWEKGQSEGIKMCFEPLEGEEGLWDSMDESQIEANYNCSQAVVSDSLFNPPAEVNFMDLQEMMQLGR